MAQFAGGIDVLSDEYPVAWESNAGEGQGGQLRVKYVQLLQDQIQQTGLHYIVDNPEADLALLYFPSCLTDFPEPIPAKRSQEVVSVITLNLGTATTQQVQPSPELKSHIKALFGRSAEEVFEDGMESHFSRELTAAIIQYGDLAILVMADLITADKVSPSAASEALRWIGDLEHKQTHRSRLDLVERSLGCSSMVVKDGAVLGLSFLDDPHATDALEEAMQSETSEILRSDMERVLEQLKETRSAFRVEEDTAKQVV